MGENENTFGDLPTFTYCTDNFFVYYVKMGKSWKYLVRFCHLLLQNEKGLKMFYDTLFHQKKIHCIKEFFIISPKITLNRFSKYSIEYWKQVQHNGAKMFLKIFTYSYLSNKRVDSNKGAGRIFFWKRING